MSGKMDEIPGVDETRARILDALTPLSDELAFLPDAAGRALAEELVSLRALPGFDNSAMDGVGVRVADVASASEAQPVTLHLVGAALAGGAVGERRLQAGEAMRVMTGAAIPPGVEAVVMREHTDERDVERGLVHVRAPAPLGQHVRRAGEDVGEGGRVGRVGDVLTPARLNLLLAAGHVRARVGRRPMVALVASGDELVEPGQALRARDVVNSNAHALAAAVRAAGAEAHLCGIAADTQAAHVERMRAASFADVLLTVGGVSMGTHDFVRPALEELGVPLEVWRVAMRPGKPIAFGRRAPVDGRGGQLVFGLPGNPVSAMVGFELFVRPALRKLAGFSSSAWLRPLLRGTLAERAEKKAGLEHWARARATLGEGGLLASLLDAQGSHQISGLAEANALVRLPRAATSLAAGASVELLLLDGG